MKLQFPYEAPPAAWTPVGTSVSRPPGFDPGPDIQVLSCSPIPVDQLYMLDLGCFDDSFFSPTQPGVAEYFKKSVLDPPTLLHGNHNDKAMWWHQSPISKQRGTTWVLREHDQSPAFAKVMSESLEKIAGKPPAIPPAPPRKRDKADPTDFTKICNTCGFLTTVKQSVQAPHADIGERCLKRFRVYNTRKGLSHACVPWIMTLPMTGGGRLVFVYGVKDHSSFCTDPLLIYVPPKHVLMWRQVFCD